MGWNMIFRLFITLALLSPSYAFAATITSKAVTGNLSTPTNWVGDVAPVAGDTIVVVAGADITVGQNITLGSNASAVGHGATVSGILRVAAGVTLTLNGFDTTSNRAMQINPGGSFLPISGSSIIVTPLSSWQTIINNDGDLIADGVVFESGEPWTFSDVGQTLTSYIPAKSRFVAGKLVYFFAVGTTVASNSSVVTSGPISNAAGTAVGSPMDNSFIITSITGGAFTPYNALQTAVSSLSALSKTGDYYVDCPNGVVYYYDTEDKSRLSISYTVKTHKWFGFGIQSIRDGNSKIILKNCLFRRLGGQWTDHWTEFSHQSVLLQYRTNGTVNSAREGEVTGNTFRYCILPLQVYDSTNTNQNPINLKSNNYLHTPKIDGNFSGNILFGRVNFADVSDSTFDTFNRLSGNILRGPSSGLVYKNLSGKVMADSIIGGGVSSVVENCRFEDTGTWGDGGGFQYMGAAGTPNVYRNNTLKYGNRAGRIGSYMVVDGNKFIEYHHHGFVAPISNGYFSEIKIKNNTIGNAVKTGDMSGGYTLGYNYTQWLDDVEIEGNTFDTGNRSIFFNDSEGTKVLGTRMKLWNNNLTNAYYGPYQPAGDADNQTKKQIQRFDHNNEYGFTIGGNVKQATFLKNGVEYNLDQTRQATGVSLFNPSTSTLGGKTLQLTVTGTPGVDLSMLLSWGGGPGVELVSTQGTATGGTSATTHVTPGTLVDSGKAWTTDAYRLDQGKILLGSGSGQEFMVRSHTGTTLTIMPKNHAGTFTAPATDSVYVILKSNVVLSDGVNTVEAGVYLPEIPMIVGTYTDSEISTVSNAVAVDPEYNSVATDDYRPKNMALKTSGLGGTYIGAFDVMSLGNPAALLMVQ